MKFMLIGLAARARCGKDTVANYLGMSAGIARYAFAYPLKRGVQEMFGLTDEQTWNDDLKEVVIPEYGMSPRQLFQLAGTEFGRDMVAQDVWVRRAKVEIEKRRREAVQPNSIVNGMVITDIRFENEAALIREQGGAVWHIERPGAPQVNAHSSEAGAAKHPDDIVLLNNGTIADLYAKVNALLHPDSARKSPSANTGC